MNFFTHSFALVVLVAAAFAAEQTHCPIACPAVYAPICAQNRNGDQQTFSSQCDFEAYICKNKESGFSVYKNGECSAIEKDTECNDMCTMEYKPVCAKNRKGESKTFPNFCEFEVFTCKNKDSGMMLLKDGDCSTIKKDDQCNAKCTDEFKPVCAKNRNGEFVTFSNLCHFNVFTCKDNHAEFVLFKNGKCSAMKKDTECNYMCTMEYKPVCAKNRKGESTTFPNFCEFEAFTCKNKDSGMMLFKDGDCSTIKKDAQCNTMCIDEYKPVCAMSRDGKFETFSNLCHFKTFTCKNKQSGFQLFKNGECSAMKKDTECNYMCTMEYKPVCAKTRNGESKTFSNICEFEAFTCKNKDSGMMLFKNGDCSAIKNDAQCNAMCIDEYKPVCAMSRDGKFETFANLCHFKTFTCKNKQSGFQLFKNGECSAMKKDTECNYMCTMEYKPVCAKNRNGESKTFSNICEFEAFTCKNKDSGMMLFKDGDCSAIKKDAQCNAMCIDEYKPVCAMSRDGKFETFANLCHFKTFTCKNKHSGFQLFKIGECSAMKKDTECNDICTMEYKPVCAKTRNGESKTFSNLCEFEAFTCKNKDSGMMLFRDGECVVAKKTENCPRVCPLNYQPICAKNRDGKFQTFPNMCELSAFTCKNKNAGFELYKEGVCSIEKKGASCSRACPLNVDPICTKNRNGEFQTFDNLCNFEAFTCKNKQSGYEFYKAGQCTEVKKTCPKACIAEYDPICTINRNGELQSFSNFCEFQMYKCNHNELELEFFRNAQC